MRVRQNEQVKQKYDVIYGFLKKLSEEKVELHYMR